MLLDLPPLPQPIPLRAASTAAAAESPDGISSPTATAQRLASGDGSAMPVGHLGQFAGVGESALPDPPSDAAAAPEPPVAPMVPAVPAVESSPSQIPSASPPALPSSDLNPVLSLRSLGVIALDADQQIYDQERQIATATGTALLWFQDGYLIADQLEVNLQSKVVLAKGKVVLVRGQQTFRADRLTYNLVQQTGRLTDVYGNLLLEDTPQEMPGSQAPELPQPPETVSGLQEIQVLQPPRRVRKVGQLQLRTVFGTNFGLSNTNAQGQGGTPNPGALTASPVETGFAITGQVRHWRFESRKIDLIPDGWNGYDVRLTNDPFTPPQFELVAQEVRFRELSADQSEVTTRDSRLLFDRRFSIPTLTNRTLISRRKRQSPITLGYDGRDRDGLFIQKSFEVLDQPNLKLTLAPQLLIQRILGGTSTSDDTTTLEATGTTEERNLAPLDYFGLVSELRYALTPTTSIDSSISLSSLNPSNFTNQTRANLLFKQVLPLQHILSLNYAYRERLFNGSLGVQTVNQAVGALFYSPRLSFNWGRLGASLEYQASVQNVSAFTDQPPFLELGQSVVVTNATRYQGAFNFNANLPVWFGQPLAATPDAGLKNTPEPIQPSVSLLAGLSGLLTNYSNGYHQNALTFRAGIEGTFGHFSKPWFDYTRFSAVYSQAFLDGQSPFLFDRIVDNKVVALGFMQHIVGPLRLGVETTLNLDNSNGARAISTNYQVQFTRRAYALNLTYNPQQQLGGIYLQINDFNWAGDGERFQPDWPQNPDK
jgi:hypothetical protein